MSLRCPSCKNRIVQKSASEVHVRARGALVFRADGTCYAQCFFCRALVDLPLELTKADAPKLLVTVGDRPGKT